MVITKHGTSFNHPLSICLVLRIIKNQVSQEEEKIYTELKSRIKNDSHNVTQNGTRKGRKKVI